MKLTKPIKLALVFAFICTFKVTAAVISLYWTLPVQPQEMGYDFVHLYQVVITNQPTGVVTNFILLRELPGLTSNYVGVVADGNVILMVRGVAQGVEQADSNWVTNKFKPFLRIR